MKKIRKVSLLIASFLILFLTKGVAVSAANEVENNNSAAKATSISVNESVTGNISSSGDVDWYRFTVPDDGYVTIQLDHTIVPGGTNCWFIDLFMEDGTTEFSGYSGTTYWKNKEYENFLSKPVGLAKGTYYIYVKASLTGQGVVNTDQYTLKINHTKSDQWEKENNGTAQLGTELRTNTDFYGSSARCYDKDWYKFTLPKDGYISVEFKHPIIADGDTGWIMEMYSVDGVSNYTKVRGTTACTVHSNTEFKTTNIGLPKGTYFIRIESFQTVHSTFDDNTYTLRVNYTESNVWEKEHNLEATNASKMTVNTDYYGSLSEWFDTDWYSFEMKESGYAWIQFEHPITPSDQTYWILSVKKSDGVTNVGTLDNRIFVKGNGNYGSSNVWLEAGKYYIEVDNASKHNSDVYTLRVVTDKKFRDVSTNAWFAAIVQNVVDNKLMTGKGSGAFEPNKNITRAEFATILYNKEGKPNVNFASKFSDVKDATKWYAKPIYWVFINNIAKGYAGTNKFGVSDAITREQIAQMLYAYARMKGLNTNIGSASLNRFADGNKVSSWAVNAMKWATSKGIINGSKDAKPRLNPQGKATRAECAAMIKNFIDCLE